MRSNNPIFNRSESFNQPANYPQGQFGAPTAAGQTPYGQTPMPTDPSAWQTDTIAPESGPRMSMDSVVTSTGITLITVITTAALTWIMTGDLTEDPANFGRLLMALVIGSLGAFVMSMVNSFKRVISPALVLVFAVLEGVALGAFSKLIDATVVDTTTNVVMSAVLGTMAAFGGTLAVYKFFEIKVSNRFRTMVIAAVFGMIGLSLLEMVLGFFGAGIGLFGNGAMGLIFAILGLVLGVFMLVLDFDFVEQGIRNGLPERESWRAAFAMTVSLVWIYTNLLRILAIMNSD